MITCVWCSLRSHDSCDGEARVYASGSYEPRCVPCGCNCNRTMGELVRSALDLRAKIEGADR